MYGIGLAKTVQAKTTLTTIRGLTMGLNLKLGSVIVALSAYTYGCQHVPVEPYPADANASAEISKVEAQRDALLADHADVLSPGHFKGGSDDLNSAVRLRTDGKADEKVLKELAQARGEFNLAADFTRIGHDVLPGVLQAREDAIKAKAPDVAGDDFRAADKELRAVSADIEDNDKVAALKKRGKIEGNYRSAEFTALKRTYLGQAMSTKELAEKEGASQYASKTLSAFNGKVRENDEYISSHRQDKAGLAHLQAVMTTDADHLLKVTRESKATGSKNGEAIVLSREAEEQRVAAAQKALEQTRAELLATEAALAATRTKSDSLEAQKSLQDRIKGVKSSFSAKEADVMQQGSNIILRLKGLDFASGSANIQTHDYALLNKVRDVITSFSPAVVGIVGHTDGRGKASVNKTLSTQRAQAVKTYLEANLGQTAAATFGEVSGMGDEQPLASNKTAAGRAKNRRVDVTITPTGIAH